MLKYFYGGYMQINKFKKIGKNKYKIYFDNTELVLYEDIILKYELLLKKDIDVFLIDKIIDENRYYDAYELALSYIEIKLRNRKEIKDYLYKKGFDDNIISFVIEKLDKLNLLNDIKYIEAFINDKITLSMDGPYKIKRLLLEFDLSEINIDNYLNTIDKDIWEEKLDKIISKKKNIMKNKSYYVFITKIKNDLYNMGYDKEMIDSKLSNIKYESNAIDKDYEKAKKKYKDDKNKLIQFLLRKGYSYDEIINKYNN